MPPDLIVYQFSRSQIERLDFAHFQRQFGQPPAGRALRALCNRFVFRIQGYDLDRREIYLVPEICRFYRAFHAAWPFWLYYCNLDPSDALRGMVLCCLDSVTGYQTDGASLCGASYDLWELIGFMALSLPPMNWLCARAGMTEPEVDQRSRTVFGHFELPYDS